MWGKTDPYKPLLDHMIDTGNVAKALIDNSSLSHVLSFVSEKLNIGYEDTRKLITYLSAMHDIGKTHPCMQQQYPPMLEKLKEKHMDQPGLFGKISFFRHELHSEQVLRRILERRGFDNKTTRYLSKIEALHHQGKKGEDKEILYAKDDWCKLQDMIEEKVYKCFPCPKIDLRESEHVDSVCMMIWSIIILSDWIASGEMASETKISFVDNSDNMEDYLLLSSNISKTAVEKCGLVKALSIPTINEYSEFWPSFTMESLRPVQRTCKQILENSQPQLMVIEAPMGEGKTEAAIYGAAKLGKGTKGLYFAMPTASTGNQMHERLQDILTKKIGSNVRLLHSTAWIIDDHSPEWAKGEQQDASNWLAPLRRGILETNAVGTVDQVMLAVMTAKYSVIRLLGLLGKILIIDEIHAYDAYMSNIIERLLSWCAELDVSVILLSATLPLRKKENLIKAYVGRNIQLTNNSYPLITCSNKGEVNEYPVNGAYMHSDVEISFEYILNDSEKVAALAIDATQNGGCVCVIVNTVEEAQRIYRKIQEESLDPDLWIRLLHARFTASERNRIEKECNETFSKGGKRPFKAILISTQVCEQSCDYDFDEMISAIAPIDYVLQRMGRIHRHELERPKGKERPKITVLLPSGESYGTTELVYSKWILDKTVENIKDKVKIMLPEEIRPLVEAVYNQEVEGNESFFEYLFVEELNKNQGKSVSLKGPNPKHFGMYDNYSLELEDEGIQEQIIAKTRLGEASNRIAFIEKEVFEQYNFGNLVTKEVARMVMKSSVPLARRVIREDPQNGFLPPVDGVGLLKGVKIYPVEGGKYHVKDDKIVGYTIDKELGVVIERR